MQTVQDALAFCEAQLEASQVCFGHGCDNPWDEAVQLVLTVAGLPIESGNDVLPVALSSEQVDRIGQLLKRRIQERLPLPYLTGRAWFAGLELRCDERAIVPRSPIGELICNDFQPWYEGPSPLRVLDLCCGGGAIGLAAAHYHPQCQVDLVDLDPRALELARENQALLGLQARTGCLQSDLFAAVAGRRYDIILSNPPYVDARDLAEMPAEYHHEPELSLGSGEDGLDLTRRILAEAADYLEPHGLLVVEVGNSWEALEAAYPRVPFTWLEFEYGGHGVFALSAAELQQYREWLVG
ncbi:50S ribosomal protein L3 N(5)-glutamine methyltransferase [Parahaliea maris]|uniref:50S ribosomal protein L3 N(5)-glutamine methyltransferase n=1 Tax=Parahaliea maris TaxID=2716870 RepID=A0A5C9A7U0_9GAMM|nr:50S ribosomal protein L3 N(5)-glutamine methyltransferase [Parahaliea maris]TXS95627.1 50S ribosomal protein L3 N(5)-glutamine methyltransferase [Parahaliea maris]